MTTIEITMPEAAVDFLSRLAALLRPEAEYPQAMFLQDALRTYEWIIRQQLNGRVVVSISRRTKAYLNPLQDAPDDTEAEFLVSFVPEDAREQVHAVLVAADPAASAGTTEAP